MNKKSKIIILLFLYGFILKANATPIELGVDKAISDGNGGINITFFINSDNTGSKQKVCIALYQVKLIYKNIDWGYDYANVDWTSDDDSEVTSNSETADNILWSNNTYGSDDDFKSLCHDKVSKDNSGAVAVDGIKIFQWNKLDTWRDNAKGTGYDGVMTLNIPAGNTLLKGKTLNTTETNLDLEIDIYAKLVRRNNGKFKELTNVSSAIPISGLDTIAEIPNNWQYPGVIGSPAVYSLVDNRVACLAQSSNGSYQCIPAQSTDNEGEFPNSISKEEANISSLVMLQCGTSSEFTPTAGYVSFAEISGSDGYTQGSWCNQLNNLARDWQSVAGETGEGWLISTNPYSGEKECLSQSYGYCLNKKIPSDKQLIDDALSNIKNKMNVSVLAFNTTSLCHYGNSNNQSISACLSEP
ncbi:hypothetical protein [uncultured Shewanella sp.]|uniref:hypothetical protein n=1 Tax=uncultured Shewanella sp. TaxID=173975 RepID=UPI002629906A|nr:hypothetical protein [uncultured Shewanella sp.]